MKLISAFLLATAMSAAHAQSWPTKTVRIIVPSPPGTAPDIITRLYVDRLAPVWGKAVIVENRPGAGGNVAMGAMVRGEKDEHVFASVMATVVTLTPHLFKELQYNIDTDVVPVAMIGTSPMMLTVNPSLGVNSVADLVKMAKEQPGKLNFALPLLNSVPHLAGEMLAVAAGVKFYPVAYNGSVAAVTATMTGESQLYIDGLPPQVAQVRAGKLKALAVTSTSRLPGFESLPTLSESYPGLKAIGWFGVLAPAGTSAAVVSKVNADITRAIQIPEVVQRFADLGVYPEPGSPQAAAEFMKAERTLWAKAVRDAGIKPQ
jgi:tripartite-type tricarboxylate transporter receptor subunit TctC